METSGEEILEFFSNIYETLDENSCFSKHKIFINVLKKTVKTNKARIFEQFVKATYENYISFNLLRILQKRLFFFNGFDLNHRTAFPIIIKYYHDMSEFRLIDYYPFFENGTYSENDLQIILDEYKNLKATNVPEIYEAGRDRIFKFAAECYENDLSNILNSYLEKSKDDVFNDINIDLMVYVLRETLYTRDDIPQSIEPSTSYNFFSKIVLGPAGTAAFLDKFIKIIKKNDKEHINNKKISILYSFLKAFLNNNSVDASLIGIADNEIYQNTLTLLVADAFSTGQTNLNKFVGKFLSRKSYKAVLKIFIKTIKKTGMRITESDQDAFLYSYYANLEHYIYNKYRNVDEIKREFTKIKNHLRDVFE